MYAISVHFGSKLHNHDNAGITETDSDTPALRSFDVRYGLRLTAI